MRSPLSCVSNVWTSENLNDDASTAITVTTATPMVSATPVAVVRFGLRDALSRASRPGAPRSHGSGLPITRLIGPANSGPIMTSPTNRRTLPMPRNWRPASTLGCTA